MTTISQTSNTHRCKYLCFILVTFLFVWLDFSHLLGGQIDNEKPWLADRCSVSLPVMGNFAGSKWYWA